MPRLVFALLANDVERRENGGISIHEVLSTLRVSGEDGPIALPRFCVAYSLEAHANEPDPGGIELRFIDQDGEDVVPPYHRDIQYLETIPGFPKEAKSWAFLVGMVIPGFGHYEIEIYSGGQRLGSTPLHVIPLT